MVSLALSISRFTACLIVKYRIKINFFYLIYAHNPRVIL